MQSILRIILVLLVLACGNLLADAAFANDVAIKWNGIGSDDAKSVTAETIDGKPGFKLVRKKDGADVHIDQSVSLKPQTLYRFTVTGFGTVKAAMRLRPASSKDNDFAGLYKAWATSSAPMAPSTTPTTPTTSELLFDTGLKTDSATLSVYLDGKTPGEYTVQQAKLTEVGSSVPAADETIILHLGDSITITSYLPFEQRVEAFISAAIKRQFPASRVRQINYGVDGEYVKELLATRRYKKVVKENLPRVDIVLIRYGANDHKAGGPDDFKKQLATLCDSIHRDYPKAAIILGTGTYLPGKTDVNKKYSPYWQASRDLAQERHYPLVDVYETFEKNGSDKLCRSSNDMHPSAAGVEVIADTTFKTLQNLLK